TATGTLMPSTLGGAVPTFTVGSGTAGACVGPSTISPGAPPPQAVNSTAVEYADTGPSTDTILRPTPLGMQEFDQLRDQSAPQTQTYQVALQNGQYLQQLDNGSIAVIGPTLPSISSTEAPGASGTPDPSIVDTVTAEPDGCPGWESDGTTDD